MEPSHGFGTALLAPCGKATAPELAPVDLVTATSAVTKSPVTSKSVAGIWAVTWLELM